MIWLSPRQLGHRHGRQKQGAMAPSLSKCVLVFLLLAVSGLVFLLRNIHSVEVSRGPRAGPSLGPGACSQSAAIRCCGSRQ